MGDLRRKKDGSGKFASESPRDPFALYELLRVVARRAAEMVNAAAAAGVIPVLAWEVTMTAFDAAAAVLIGEGVYKSVPPARTIGKLLPDRNGRPFAWRPLLKLVFDERSIERVHMERLTSPDNPYLGEQHVYYALNMIARLLKKRTLTGLEYQIQREMLVRADARRPNGGHLARVLPTFGQISFFIKERYLSDEPADDSSDVQAVREGDEEVGALRRQIWAIALEIAKLDPPSDTPNVVRESVPLMDASIRFYETVGFLPSEPKLRTFARDFNFALEGVRNRNWRNEMLPLVRAEIERRGLPTPPDYDPRRQTLKWDIPEVSPWPDDPPHRPKTFYTHAMVLTVAANFRDWLPRGQAPTYPLYVEFSRNDPDKPSTIVIHEHGGLDQLFEELASPDALERAYRELNPTAQEIVEREAEQLEDKLRHPTPQGILRVITERGEAGSREIAGEIGVEQATVKNWIPLLIEAQKIDTTTPSRVAKNVKYCLKGNAPTPDVVRLRKIEAQVAGSSCQRVLRLLEQHGELTAREFAAEIDTSPEVVAKWLRPLKELKYIEQIDEGGGTKRKTYYRLLKLN